MKKFWTGILMATVVGTMNAHAQQPDLNEMMKAVGAMMNNQGTNAAAQLVDHRELKTLLPAEVKGMKRTTAKSEKSGAMGITIVYAEGHYEGNDSTLTIKITDGAGMGGMMAMAQVGWANAEIDSETETGYEKTMTIKGHKAMMKYDKSSKDGEIHIFVQSRYIVELDGNDITEEALMSALDSINLNKLAALQPKSTN